jgi:hypothetical protein
LGVARFHLALGLAFLEDLHQQGDGGSVILRHMPGDRMFGQQEIGAKDGVGLVKLVTASRHGAQPIYERGMGRDGFLERQEEGTKVAIVKVPGQMLFAGVVAEHGAFARFRLEGDVPSGRSIDAFFHKELEGGPGDGVFFSDGS